jgi:hypothetical protein
MRAKRVMSANLPRNKTEGNGYHVDAFESTHSTGIMSTHSTRIPMRYSINIGGVRLHCKSLHQQTISPNTRSSRVQARNRFPPPLSSPCIDLCHPARLLHVILCVKIIQPLSGLITRSQACIVHRIPPEEPFRRFSIGVTIARIRRNH